MNLDSTFSELSELDVKGRSSEFTRVISLLLDAERDCRTPNSTIREFIENVEHFIGDSITKNTITLFLNKSELNHLHSAWEVEALEYLLEILQSYPDKNLRLVLNEI